MTSTKRALGQYSTPSETVDYMISLVWSHIQSADNPTVLDPAVGDGVFVDRLTQHGVPPSQIFAYDIDERAVTSLATRHRQVLHQDFLQVDDGNYDLIIGNPPYKSKRESTYIQTNRTCLEQQFSGIGLHNLYSMFTVHAIRNLKEGGFVCFIVQDSFLTNVYYSHFRRYILNHCKIHKITLAPRRLFHHTDADVRTAILLLEKYTQTGPAADEERANHNMALTDRLADESELWSTPMHKLQYIPQRLYTHMDQSNFFVNVPLQIIDLIEHCKLRLADVVRGGTGISTGDDAQFLRKVNDIPAAEADEWIPFYKNGGVKDAWSYQTSYRIHRDWQTNGAQSKDFLIRNADCYLQEGITCSSMGVAFSAAYLPVGCLFGVNANFFTNSREDLFYILAFLNSKLARYMVRAVFNRTNMVTAGYLKRLPYIEPTSVLKRQVVDLAASIVRSIQENPEFEYIHLHATVDSLIYQIYGISPEDTQHIERFCANLNESI